MWCLPNRDIRKEDQCHQLIVSKERGSPEPTWLDQHNRTLPSEHQDMALSERLPPTPWFIYHCFPFKIATLTVSTIFGHTVFSLMSHLLTWPQYLDDTTTFDDWDWNVTFRFFWYYGVTWCNLPVEKSHCWFYLLVCQMPTFVAFLFPWSRQKKKPCQFFLDAILIFFVSHHIHTHYTHVYINIDTCLSDLCICVFMHTNKQKYTVENYV